MHTNNSSSSGHKLDWDGNRLDICDYFTENHLKFQLKPKVLNFVCKKSFFSSNRISIENWNRIEWIRNNFGDILFKWLADHPIFQFENRIVRNYYCDCHVFKYLRFWLRIISKVFLEFIIYLFLESIKSSHLYQSYIRFSNSHFDFSLFDVNAIPHFICANSLVRIICSASDRSEKSIYAHITQPKSQQTRSQFRYYCHFIVVKSMEMYSVLFSPFMFFSLSLSSLVLFSVYPYSFRAVLGSFISHLG